MMINIIHYDVAASIIFLVLIINVHKERHVETRSNLLLLCVLYVGLLSALSDMLAAIFSNTGRVSFGILIGAYASNYVYFAMHNILLPIYVLFIMASLDIWHIFMKKLLNLVLWAFFILLDFFLLMTNFFTHKVFYIDENMQYQRGPHILIFYMVAFLYMIVGMFIIIKYRSIISKAKRGVLLVLFPLIAVSLLIQAKMGNALVENFAVASGLMLYVIVIQRNENPVDPDTGALKYYRAIERAFIASKTSKPFSVIFIKILNSNNIQIYLGRERFYQYLKIQSEQFEQIAATIGNRVDVYYLENGLYALFMEDSNRDRAIAYANFISRYYEDTQYMDHLEINADTVLCVAKCPDDLEEYTSLITLATTFYKTVGTSRKVINFADYRNNKDFRIRNELDNIIRNALTNNKFEMYYQPIYSIERKRYVSAEALIRLRDEKYGFIPPDIFIPAAEESGAIHEVGDFVLRDVCRFIANNGLDELGLDYIELNLSASQCIEVNLIDKVKSLLKEYNIPANRLRMELTETAADINPAVVGNNVKKLSELGIHFALDDYGTGYSNIRRVTSLPFVQVKLDKSFVEEIDNPVMWNVIKDTITMFKEMGKEVLVEGVENESVAMRFSELNTDLLQGCELMQGFFFCRPMPADKFVMYMHECVEKGVNK